MSNVHHHPNTAFVHFQMPTAPPGVEDSENDICCDGAAYRGAAHCTCWIPVYDLEQKPAVNDAPRPEHRAKCCGDCAFRNQSPEALDGRLDDVKAKSELFFCHQGMRRIVRWHHPDGREMPAGEGNYDPTFRDPRTPLLADGTPAPVCAGFRTWLEQLDIPLHPRLNPDEENTNG